MEDYFKMEKEGLQIRKEINGCIQRLIDNGYDATLVSIEVLITAEAAKEGLKSIGMDDLVKQVESSTKKAIHEEVEKLSDDKQTRAVMGMTMQFIEGLKSRGFKAEIVANVMELTGKASSNFLKDSDA